MNLKIDKTRLRDSFRQAPAEEKKRSATGRIAFLVALGIAYLLLEIFITKGFLRIEVTINSKDTYVSRGIKVGDLHRYEPAYRNGDLIAVNGSLLVKEGGGNPPLVFAKGRKQSADTMLLQGDELSVFQGSDSYEPFELKKVELPFALSTTGRGPIFKQISAGRNGYIFKRVGSISGSEDVLFVSNKTDLTYEKRLADKGRYIALTFDDGPTRFTPGLLGYLASEDVKATFFVVGKNAQQYPWLIRKMRKDGHLIANHTYGHAQLTKLTPASARYELARASQIIESVGGGEVSYFRPPYGLYNDSVLRSAGELGLAPVMWNVDPQDWTGISRAQIYDRVMDRTRGGVVILLHDGGGVRDETVASVRLLVPKLKQLGFQFVTIDEMLKLTDKK